jgi:formylmethanofuran dehydrogenase subunit E
LNVSDEKLETAIKNAEELHGHLGPFLVVGVRIGNIAKTILHPDTRGNNALQATARIPFLTPFSCVLDGIQATTQCTVGNQRLRIENSEKEITVCFKLQKSDTTVKVSVNQKKVEELMRKISEGSSNEELAQKVAQEPESQLFTIEKQ